MYLDIHGSGIAMVMLTLGILVVLYVDSIGTGRSEIMGSFGPTGSALLMSILVIMAFLGGVRAHR